MKVYLAFERGIQLALQSAGRLQAWRVNRLAARIGRRDDHEIPHFQNERNRHPFMSSHPAVIALGILTPSAGGAGTRVQQGHLRYSA